MSASTRRRSWVLRGTGVLLLVVSTAVAARDDADRQRWYCHASVVQMIRIGENAVEQAPDDVRAPRRRGLLHEWQQRLLAGEDPCRLYREIVEHAAGF